MKKVYVVCATGIATSTMIRLKIENFLREHGVEAAIRQFRVTELAPSRIDADAIVATMEMPAEFAEVVPVLNGISLLTGVGEAETLQRLLEILKE